ncbi:MAG: DUF2760 domain-containing protein [Polyangiaceae bacterium]
MPTDTLSLATRLWFSWLCFFRVLFDSRFAARVWSEGRASRLPPFTRTPEQGPAPALHLLALLQREGRFIDFLQQDIASFPDPEIGAAARVVHEGCRKALRAHATIEPLRGEAEGSQVTLPLGFDADEVTLVGNVTGQPPYTGVLRHRGWRATTFELPRLVGEHDAEILAAAEVELR